MFYKCLQLQLHDFLSWSCPKQDLNVYKATNK
jgi:hypothetical protein